MSIVKISKIKQIVREIPQTAVDFIRQEEGLITQKYFDIAGYPTICVGHLIRPSEEFPDEMSEEQCEDLLRKDLLSVAVSIMRLINISLTENQYIALLSFTFNLGNGALQRSTLRSKLNRGEYEEAADEFPKWCLAGGKRIKGLYDRRLRERELFLT